MWVTYMAIEPYVRRVWPRMLVGLVRLLSGRLRDPAVRSGGDIVGRPESRAGSGC